MRLRLFKNLPYKVLSLLFAISFWFFLVIFQNVIYDVADPIQLEILNNPEGLEMANELPDIQVRVTAPKDEASFLRADDFQAYIDLKDLGAGVETLPIQVSTVRGNVNIVSYVPSEIEVILEEVQSKSFAIRAEIIGMPEGDYMVGEPSYTPRKATVNGPKSLIENIAYLGHKITLNKNNTESTENTYVLMAYDHAGNAIERGLKITPEMVKTKLELIKTIDEKSIPIRLAYAKEVDTGRIRESSVSPSVLLLRGPVDVLQGVQYINTVPITRDQVKEIIAGVDVFVDFVIPEGLELMSEEKQVQVTIR